MEEFVFLAPYVRHFSIGEAEEKMDVSCQKRLERFIRTTGKEVRIIVCCDGRCGSSDQIASVEEDYEFATLNPARIMVRKELLERKEGVDFMALCRIFLSGEKFGVFAQHPEKEPDPKTPCPCRREGTYGTKPEAYRKILSMVREKYGEIPPFYQNLLLKDLFHLFSVLEPEAALPLKYVLMEIEDDIICSCGCIPEDLRIRILSFKHGKEVEAAFAYRSGILKYDNLPVLSLKEIPFVIEEIKNDKSRFNIIGTALLPLSESEIRYSCLDQKNKKHDIVWEEGEETVFLGEKLHTRKRFRVDIETAGKPAGLRFMYCYRELYKARIRIAFDESTGMEKSVSRGVCLPGGYLLRLDQRILSISPLAFQTRIKLFFTFPRKSIKMYLDKK